MPPGRQAEGTAMRNVRWSVISMVLVLAIRAPRAPGGIVSAFFKQAESVNLTAAGTKDWAVFGLQWLQADAGQAVPRFVFRG